MGVRLVIAVDAAVVVAGLAVLALLVRRLFRQGRRLLAALGESGRRVGDVSAQLATVLAELGAPGRVR